MMNEKLFSTVTSQEIEKWACAFHKYGKDFICIKPRKVLMTKSNNTFITIDYFDEELNNKSKNDYMFELTTKIFDTEQECADYFNKEVFRHAKSCQQTIKEYENQFNFFERQFYNTDYMMEKMRQKND